MHDLIIIGAGPAGITASVYAARKRMDFLVISEDIGGQTAWSGDIENYTGYQFITGIELTAKFQKHMKKYAVSLKENETITALKKQDNAIVVETNNAKYQARTVIVASGKRSRELNVPGENKFKNRGLTYCATCDGPVFAGKDVAVIGGGNSGLEATIQLIKIAKHIYLINNTGELTGDKIMQDKVTKSKQVTVLNNTQVLAVLGDKLVSALEVETNQKKKKLSVEGVFVEIGLIPNSEFAAILDKNQWGEIKVDSHNATNVSGIFAAGDVTDVPEKQIIIAAGEGSKAALGAFRYLAMKK